MNLIKARTILCLFLAVH